MGTVERFLIRQLGVLQKEYYELYVPLRAHEVGGGFACPAINDGVTVCLLWNYGFY